jgi:hypothetical protein
MDEKMHPKFDYYVDKSDPDIVVLRRQEGSFVAAFSARGGHEVGYRGGRQGGLRQAGRGSPSLPTGSPHLSDLNISGSGFIGSSAGLGPA